MIDATFYSSVFFQGFIFCNVANKIEFEFGEELPMAGGKKQEEICTFSDSCIAGFSF